MRSNADSGFFSLHIMSVEPCSCTTREEIENSDYCGNNTIVMENNRLKGECNRVLDGRLHFEVSYVSTKGFSFNVIPSTIVD